MAVSRITRTYQNLAGVDFSNDNVAVNRSPDSLNMWKDYSDTMGRCIQSRPDFELDEAYPTSVYGLFYYTTPSATYKVVHSGTTLYSTEQPSGSRLTIFTGMNPSQTKFFVYNNVLYIKDGLNYLQFNGTSCTSVSGYVPTTSIARSPLGSGTVYEDVNLLTGERINTFIGDGTSTEYFVDSPLFDSNYTELITIDGVALVKGVDFTVDSSAGKITFVSAPAAPSTVGQPNVSIQYRKTISGYRDRIVKCSLVSVFDNRVFFSGNQDYPNVLFHSGLNNPAYCSDTDYYNEGMDLSKIKALIAGENALWVIKEPSQGGRTVFYHQPVVDSTYGKIYPSQYSVVSTGCSTVGTNYADDIVFFSPNGLECISGGIQTEKIASHRSSLVDGKLLSDTNYANMLVEEYSGYLLTIVGNKVFLADARQVYANVDHYEYEWYYWELTQTPISTRVYNGVLYIGTSDGIYSFTSVPEEMTSYWTTPEDEFGTINHLKTTNKRGGLVNLEGDELTVETKKDNEEFQSVGTYDATNGYVVYRIKEKKFKNLQVRFKSTTPFKLYSASLEAYVGSYIKR